MLPCQSANVHTHSVLLCKEKGKMNKKKKSLEAFRKKRKHRNTGNPTYLYIMHIGAGQAGDRHHEFGYMEGTVVVFLLHLNCTTLLDNTHYLLVITQFGVTKDSTCSRAEMSHKYIMDWFMFRGGGGEARATATGLCSIVME